MANAVGFPLGFCHNAVLLLGACADAYIVLRHPPQHGMISAVGVRNVVENQVDFTKSRNVLITALILVIAIGMKYGTGDIGGIAFRLGGVNIQMSSRAIAAIVGIVMNAILPGKDYEFGTNEQGDTSVNFGSRNE